MKVAITSVSGKLGSSIAKAVIDLLGNNNVIGLARTPSKVKDLGIEVRPGDYNKKDDLIKSLESIDVVLLVSGMDTPEKRIGQHRNVIEAAKQAGVKKIVYTSIQGAQEGTAFSAVVQSNRQTEEDIRNSSLEYVIGRNGIYIEPDIEYIENYKRMGGIFNCAGDGKCGYTNRDELAYAYAKMLTENIHNGKTYNLNGEALTQQQLADYLNMTYNTNLKYKPLSVEEFKALSTNELGEFLGTIISGIYEGIQKGECDNPSDFKQAAGREHQSWDDYFKKLKASI